MQRTKGILIKSLVFIIILVSLIIIFYPRNNYSIKITEIDDKSPDRVLEVYNNKKKISFKKIEVNNNTLCTYDSPYVYYGELMDIEEVTVILNNNKSIKIKLEKE